MAGRRTNLALLVVLALATATGALSYALGTAPVRVAVVAHGICGISAVVLAPWKSVVVRRGFARRDAHRGGARRRGAWPAIGLAVLLVVSVLAGVLHAVGVAQLGAVTAMQVHVGAALALVPLAVWHVAVRPVPPRRTDLSRRNLLAAGGVFGAAAVAWIGLEATIAAVGARGATRRSSGSYETGSGRPDEMPVTQWLDDDVPSLDREAWRLTIRDARGQRTVAHADVDRDRAAVTAVLDCTGGWYAEQRWEGTPVAALVDPPADARSILVTSTTGYARRFPIRDLPALLLATRAGDQLLSAGHGAPARIVAPGRRGFWWVKWVATIETSTRPWWLQSPFPLT